MSDCTTLNVREEIIERMAHYMWDDALMSTAEEVGIKSEEFKWEHTENVPQAVTDVAGKWLRSIEEFNGRTSPTGDVIRKCISDIAHEIGAMIYEDDEEIDELGYYCYMQTCGHGVAWTDNRIDSPELKTPYMESPCEAREAAYELLSADDRAWYDAKELTHWSAVHACIGTDRMMRKLTPREHGGLDEEILTPKQAETLIYTHAAIASDCPLLMVADWREE